MERIVDQILEIEQRAQEMVKEAQTDREKKLAEIGDECSKIDKDILSRKSSRIKMIIKEEEAQMEERINEICGQIDEEDKRLTEKYAQKKDDWAREIFDSVIKTVSGGMASDVS